MKQGTLKIIGLNLLITVVLFIVLEGLASLLLAVKETGSGAPAIAMAEEKHTRFDPLLGWINLPDLHLENMYGKGVYLTTNSQAFRNEKFFPAKKKAGQKRILCVGDSFTFGYGVSNRETWCHLLSEYLPNVETVNMGQGGYGVDQAYLWYQRDGVKLEHDLVLFGFITSDFYRMQNPEFHGHSKPVLRLEDGRLEVIPPKPPETGGKTEETSKLWAFLKNLRMTQVFQKLAWKIKLWGTTDGVLSPAAKQLTGSIFQDLKTIAAKNQARVLLVHLPNADDFPSNGKTDALRKTLGALASEAGLTYADVVAPVQALPTSFDAHLLFEYGNRHFNAKGNRFVARHLQAQIEKALAPAG